MRAVIAPGAVSSNIVEVEVREPSLHVGDLQRNFFAASSCGICGKASINAIRNRDLPAPNPDFRFNPELLCELPELLRKEQEVFSRTGGLHAAALFDEAAGCLPFGRTSAVIMRWIR